MKINRITLCYPDMDRIIVDREKDLEKYDLAKVSGVDVSVSLSLDEFNALREKSLLMSHRG